MMLTLSVLSDWRFLLAHSIQMFSALKILLCCNSNGLQHLNFTIISSAIDFPIKFLFRSAARMLYLVKKKKKERGLLVYGLGH